MASAIKDLAKAMYEIEQIKQLKARYFRLLDGKKWSDWRTCFTDDMHFYVNDESVPRARSGDEFVALVSSLLADAATVHQGHMPEIELTSDQAAKGIWAMFDWVDDKKNLDKSRQG